ITILNSLVITALRGLKWNLILSGLYHQRLSFTRIFNLMLIGQFFAFFTPARVGDLGRAKYLKDELGYKKSFASVIVDKIFDVIAIGVFAVLGFIYMCGALAGLVGFYLTALILFFVLASFFCYIFRGKLMEFHLMLSDFEKKTDSKLFLEVFFLSMLIWFLTYLQFYFAVLMVNESASLLDVISLASVYTVILFLPISINGIGVREGASAVLFPLINIRMEVGVVIAWIVAINNSLFPAVLGYISLLREK
ncbi:MAG: flippase-like domain-containing protein, partial [Candidatus Altiarchaeales archaeon]|nr:flippase-like domain-containing protein [Candidatus Altiarchaeales archaeon]